MQGNIQTHFKSLIISLKMKIKKVMKLSGQASTFFSVQIGDFVKKSILNVFQILSIMIKLTEHNI